LLNLLYGELADLIGARPSLKQAVASGIFDVLMDLAVVELLLTNNQR
jgi:hypothetical protein